MGGKKLINPFPGLRPFRPDESDLFFGRGDESKEVCSRLTRNRFITVIGASGSGKSSLIYCGVIPNFLADEKVKKRDWKVLAMRPGNEPLRNLASSLGLSAGVLPAENLKPGLIRMEQEAQEVLEGGSEQLLLVIDQFEELFRYQGGRKDFAFSQEAYSFVNIIVKAINNPRAKLNVIITMRSDFIGECSHFQGLTELINNSNYLVPHMSAENYRQAISGPVAWAGGSISEELVENLVGEIGERTDQLPVLQHALMRSWDHWTESDGGAAPLGMIDYESIGKMSESMSKHANEAYEELSGAEQRICETLFKTITEKGNDNKGIRHPTKVSLIAEIAGCAVEELYPVIEVFRGTGRSFITPPSTVLLTPDTVIDVSHESLMRVWDKLAEWVDEEAASVQMYMRLSESSALFHEGKTTLWRPPDLQLAINWKKENNPSLAWARRFNPAFERAMVYLKSSEKEYLAEEENKIISQKRELRRSKITAIVLGTAAIISVLFMVYAFIQQTEAENNKIEADRQKEVALEQEMLAIKNAEEAKENAAEASEQRNIAEEKAEEARQNANVANIERQRALTNEERANLNAELAKKQEAEAVRNAEIATRNEKIATEQREEARRLRMVSIGKSMAIKSVQMPGQRDLQALMAFQAYLFNKRSGGLPNDADIFMGLYNVAKANGTEGYQILKGHSGSVRSIAFVPGKDSFITSGTDGKVILWNSVNPEEGAVLYEGDEIIEVLAASSDGKLIACGTDRSVIRLVPLVGGATRDLAGHSSKIKAMSFSPDSKYLYSVEVNGTMMRWDMSTYQSSVSGDGKGIISTLDISPSGNLLSVGTADGKVIIQGLKQKRDEVTLALNQGSFNVIRFRDEESIAVGFTNGTIGLFSTSSGLPLGELKGHISRVSDIRFNRIKKQMASGSLDGTIKIWNLDDFTEPPISLSDNSGFVLSLAYSEKGDILVSGSDSQTSNLIVRPIHLDFMTSDLCSMLSRNFTAEEWRRYIGADIAYEETCQLK